MTLIEESRFKDYAEGISRACGITLDDVKLGMQRFSELSRCEER